MITLDHTHASSDPDLKKTIDSLLAEQKEKLNTYIDVVEEKRSHPLEMLEWVNLPMADVTAIESYVEDHKKNFTDLVVLGVGGSALGARSTIKALGDEKNGIRVHILDNIDPDRLRWFFENLNPKRTLVNVISKSGTTTETVSQYIAFKVWFESSRIDVTKHIVMTTSAHHGLLRRLADSAGYESFSIPEGVGGRFSVLSAVGLLPIAFAGVNITELLAGAAAANLDSFNKEKSSLSDQLAVWYYYSIVSGKSVNVMMPYASKLSSFGDWFAQLWAESLGKQKNLNGRDVFTGQTPLPSMGVTDQHSLAQLYNEGPHDKVFTFLSVKEFAQDYLIAGADFDLPEEIAYLKGKSFMQLLDTERKATTDALSEHKRSSVTLMLDKIDAWHMGYLYQTYMWVTAFTGNLLGINTFNQPGVELAKKLTKEYMKKV